MNRVYLNSLSTKSLEQGFILSDDYDQDTRLIEDVPDDDLELLLFAVDNCSPNGRDILDFCVEEQRGITINEVFYPYEKIKDILEKEG